MSNSDQSQHGNIETRGDVAVSEKKKWNIELIVAISLGILALACFTGQVLTVGQHTTATETFLFNSLQFILTSGFAWFSTRAASRLEFEQSLKKFAISAYRRAADIERMVDRLHAVIAEMISAPPKSEMANLRVIDAIVTDTGQLVRSSISDWGDVIGEELLAIERIKRLEIEKARLHDEEQSSNQKRELAEAVERIDQAIETIQRSLPPRLQLETETEDRGVRNRHAAEWLAKQHRKQNGLEMTVVTGDIYLHERDRKTLVPGEILHTALTEDEAIDVRDEAGKGVGRLTNVSPLNYGEFVKAMKGCYGDGPLELEFIELTGERMSKSEGLFAWIKVRVRTEPLPRGRGRAKIADGDQS